MSTGIDESWINKEIKKSIIKYQKNKIVVNEGVFSSIAGLLGKVPFLERYGKKIIISKISDAYGLDNTSNFINVFIVSMLEVITLQQFVEIYTHEITRDEILEILVSGLAIALTREAVEEILIFLLRNYDIEDLVNNVLSYDPTFGKEDKLYTVDSLLPAGKKDREISENQARAIMNSMIGTIGLAVIERFVEKAARENILPKIADVISGMEFDELKDAAGKITKK